MKRQILISLVILLSIGTSALSTEWHVPGRDYPTIQSAIDAPSTVNGDVIVVAPGIYTGPGNVDLDFKGKAITVRSEINPDNPNWDIISATIIDCQGNKDDPHRAFYFRNGEGTDSKVLGFTIINGYGRGPKGPDGQFGYNGNPLSGFDPVSVDPTADPTTLPPRAIDGNDATGDGYGGAILCAGASPTIQYCVISDCTVTGAQGGDGAGGLSGTWLHWTIADFNLAPGPGYLLLFPDAEQTENTDGQWGGHGGAGSGNGYGGAIACLAGSSPIISDCIISDNFARGGCGGDGGNGGNAANPPDYDQGLESGGGNAGDSIGDGMGGGIYCDVASSPTITTCTFNNNIAMTGIRGTGGQRGLGNIFLYEDIRVSEGFDSLVFPAGHIAGGAAYYGTNSDANFTNCTFTGNKAYEAYTFYFPALGEDISVYTVGGALYSVANNTITLDTCEFTGNLGGAVYCDSGCNLNFDDCLFSDNSETANGGALYIEAGGSADIHNCIFSGNSAYDDGGALECRSDAIFTNCSFGNNIADSNNDGRGYGGGVDVYDPGTTLIVDFNNCSFAGNQAIYGGGFSSENFDANFTDCYFIGNTALDGGGLDLVNGDVNVIGGVVKGNNATDGDGGGFNCSYTTAEIRDCTISDNFADGVYPSGGNGGAINFYGGAPTQTVFNCLITGNKASVDGGAIFCHNASPEIGNCTFSDNLAANGYGGAIFSDFVSEPNIIDCIFEGCNNHAIHEEDPGGNAIVTYSLFYINPDGDYADFNSVTDEIDVYQGPGEIGNIPGGIFNLYGDPLFESGPLGNFYLNQASSPAVDNGSDTAANLGLDSYTTDAANALDSGQVDRGYHYLDIANVVTFQLTASVIGGNGTIEPTSGTYYAGTVVTLTATPGSGWRVKAWSGTDDDSSTATTNSVVMNFNRTVTVEFEQPKILIVAVGGGGEGFYSNLTDALHDAEDGDTIVVYPGVYYGPQVQVNKDVEIRSQHPDDPNWVEQTIIDSTGHAGPVFLFDSDRGPGCILNGFTIQNSTWYTDWGEDGDDPGENGEDGFGAEGGAIWIASGAGPVIKNCLIRDNYAHGGFGGTGSNADEFHNAGRGGWGGWAYGGAVYCGTNSSPTFINCRIINNQAIGGIGGNGGNEDPDGGTANYGGNWSRAEWWNRLTDSTAWEWVQGDLWEVWLTTLNTDPYIVGDPYIGDYRWYSGYGGGVFIDRDCNVTFVNCTISGNLAQGGLSGLGGEEPGVGPYRAKPFPLQYEIPSFGGGVYCAADSNVTFTGCTITDNVSSEPLFDHTVLVDGFDLPHEWIQDEYDPCDTYSSDPYLGHGGGVCAEDTATVIFTDCQFSGNKAAVGGGIHGGNANLEVSDCEFISNSAYQGGGLFGEHGPATINNSNFTNNIASSDANEPNALGQGGAMHFWATEADIIDCNIRSNQAEASGGGVYFGGESAPSLTNCLLTENTAGRDGGGISANIFNQLAISNCTIAGNIVTGIGFEYGYGGGLHCSYGSYTNIIDSILWGNSSTNGSQIAVGTGFEYDLSPSAVDVSYSDVQGGEAEVWVDVGCTLNWLEGSIDDDPFFAMGPLGDYYLSQSPAQLPPNSPAVNAGSVDLNDPNFDPVSYGWDPRMYTTRTDNVGDINWVDMGYHHFFVGDVNLFLFELTASVIGGNGTIEPTSGTYYAGTVVTLTATPGSGWRVKAWSGTDDDASTDPCNSVTMDSDKTVTVEFDQPRTLIVAVGGGQGYYSTIPDAVSDAEDGDTVVVYPGTYYGGYLGLMIRVDKSITIRSMHPDDPCYVAATIIDGYNEYQFNEGYNNTGVTFGPRTDANTILNGFTIQNCGGYWGTADDGDRDEDHPDGYDAGGGSGPAITIYSGGGPVIKNCVIRDNLVLGGDGGAGVGATDTENAGRGGWGGFAYGGAVYCAPNSSPAFINCQIIDNYAEGGNGGDGGDDAVPGGLPNYGGNWSIDGTPEYPVLDIDPNSLNITPIIDSGLWEVWQWDLAASYLSTFGVGNGVNYIGDYRWYSGYGGGVFCDTGSTVTFTDCTISGNLAQGGVSGQGGIFTTSGRPIEPLIPYEIPSFGGGVYCADETTVTFTGCTITGNVSSEPNENNSHLDPYLGHGGGVCAEDTATIIFTDCTFSENEAAVGGGIHFADANPIISDCNFTNNSAFQGGGLFGEHGPVTILRSNFTNNEAVSDPNDPNVVILGEGGGLHLWATDANIIDCNISSNQAEASGGGVYFGGEGNTSVFNCLVTDNTAGRDGGGISANIFNQLAISNCTIAGNIVTGIGFEYGYGGGLHCSYGSYTNIIDSILWGNTSTNGRQIAIGTGFEYDPLPSTVDVSYSDVKGAQTNIFVDTGCTLIWDASSNIYVDPLFVTGPLGDYYLSQTDTNEPNQTTDSPCVDAGSDLATTVGLHLYTTRTDDVFDTNMVDMGYHYPLAIELCSFSDLSNDGIVNFVDFAIFLLYWLDEDCSADNNWCGGADLTLDSYVNFNDLASLYECWLIEDTSPPLPNPSEWEIEPYSTTMSPSYAVSMTAEAAFDNWGGVVEYYFECFTGNGSDRGWEDPNRTNRTYTDSNNLDPNTVYGYRVKARDERGNETLWSVVGYTITGMPEPAEAPAWVLPYVATPNSIWMQVTTSDPNGIGYVDYYFDEISGNPGGSDSSWQAGLTYIDTGLDANTTYTYRARAIDENGQETDWSQELQATTLTEQGEEPNEPNEPDEPNEPNEPPPPDTTPPTPNPSQWAVGGEPSQYGPDPNGYYRHTMTAEPASDAENEPVEYYFELVAGGNGPQSSGWQLSNVYDYAVSANPAQYGVYKVRTRDAVGNMTDWSELGSTL